jgi:hypothetical protein
MNFFNNLLKAAVGDGPFFKQLRQEPGLFNQAVSIIACSIAVVCVIASAQGKFSLAAFGFALLFAAGGWLLVGYLILIHGKRAWQQEKGEELAMDYQQALTISGFCQTANLIIGFFSWVPPSVGTFLGFAGMAWSIFLLFTAFKETFELKPSKAAMTTISVCFWYLLVFILIMLLIGYLLHASGVKLPS